MTTGNPRCCPKPGNPPRAPRRTFRCTNPVCPWYGVPRTITLQHVGQGIYLSPRVSYICECGAPVAWAWYIDMPQLDEAVPREPDEVAQEKNDGQR